jgi:DNA-binding NtrC family response regulator
VLVVEDEPSIREGLVRALRAASLSVIAAESLAEARAALRSRACDCVLLDLRLPDGNGLDVLAEIRTSVEAPPVIVATSYDDGERIIRAMRLGAHEYVTKPFDLPALRNAVLGATRAQALSRSVGPPGGLAEDGDLVGRCAAMRTVWKAIGRAAASDASVLVTGPTGAGKEVVARAIHRHSDRQRGPFVAVNLAGLPASLLESELFGHEKGAFTGAAQRREGRVAAAAGGTLFLDEIGDLAPELQTKLLRLPQERTFERVGGTEPIAATVRFVAATHAPVRPGAAGGRLRPDIYHRLAVLEIEVPPLAERRDDIPLLVRHGLDRVSARGISADALAALVRRDWPGNVRELLHVVERAAVLAGSEVVDLRHLPEPTPQANVLARALAEQLGTMSMHEAVALVERTMVSVALEREKGNRSRAARLLGIGRPLLYAKMREHDLNAPPEAEEEDG